MTDAADESTGDGAGRFVPDDERWNRNIHYHPLLLALRPATRVLDVGTGGGLLARQFAPAAGEVVGIDPDAASIELARSETPYDNVSYVQGDVLTHEFEPESFDAVVSVATLHHFDAAQGLRRFAELTEPGGHVGVIGIGAPGLLALPRNALAFAATRCHEKVRGKPAWEHSAPMVWPPPLSERAMRELSADVLPGSRFRRRLHGRYSIIWRKPD